MTLSERDQVRLMVGDTDTTDLLLADDEVDQFINGRALLDSSGGTVSTNLAAAAADCAGAIAAEFAREFNFTSDGQGFQRAQRVGHYQALEQTLRARAGGVSVPLSIAGTATT